MPWVRRVRVEYPPLPVAPIDVHLDVPLGSLMCTEIVEDFWQDPDGTLIPRAEYEAQSMPRTTPWYDRRASARDPNRELTEEVRRAEARAERERWERSMEEQRRADARLWSNRGTWVTGDFSTFQTEQTATQRNDLMGWYRDSITTWPSGAGGRITIHTGPAPTYDDRIDSFFTSPRIPSMASAYQPADLDKPFEVHAANTFLSGAYGFLDDNDIVHYFCDNGSIPCAHFVRILVRYYGTEARVKALFASGAQVAYVTPSAVVRDGGVSIGSLPWSRWDGGTPCSHPGRTNYAVFMKGAWHIRTRDDGGSLSWERLDPDTL